MANLLFDPIVDSGGTQVAVLDTTATGASAIPLGAGSGNSGPAGWTIQLTGTAATFGSLVPKVRLRGSSLTGSNLASTLAYQFDSETAVASSTMNAIATVYYVPTDECDLFLEYTAGATAMTVYARPGRV